MCSVECGLLLQTSWRSVVSVCVCLLDTLLSPAQTAELIETPFELKNPVDLRNHVIWKCILSTPGEYLVNLRSGGDASCRSHYCSYLLKFA